MLVSVSQFLTLADAPDLEPVTTSLNQYVPIPVVAAVATVTVGAEKKPAPASVMLIALIVPAALTVATAEAGSCGDSEGRVNVTFGAVEYPAPPLVTTILTTPFLLV